MAVKEKEAMKVREQLDQTSGELKRAQLETQNAVSEKLQGRLKVEEQKEKIDMLVIENNNLKEKIHEQEDDIKRFKKEIKKFQQQIEDETKTKELLEKV